MSGTRLDVALAERGLASSRTHAAALVAEGRVRVNGRAAAKPGARVSPEDVVEVVEGATPDFVSRAGQKLYGALGALPGVSVAGRRCLDAGASTGGFTDVLLRAGAGRVVAVDVGHGQLVDSLRADSRVDVHEGLNVRALTPEMIGGPVDVTVGDLSFISLTLVLGPLAGATVPGGDLVLMIKPQFEAGRERVRGGVVRDPLAREAAVRRVLEAGERHGLALSAVAPSPLPGQDGNREYFAHWVRGTAGVDDDAPAAADTRPAAEAGPRTPGNAQGAGRMIDVTEALAQLRSAGAFDAPPG
ncbi:TlyA family RNA methyltransferase [Falsarthrobacter nasiphocae]|uniref:23S rRNA (Cytidine1920-2'-O)/16S rRNA (Cytidine1409-2'-O)-methyltransferase n=1 Tax=Falsarthrobacter nasiphocae TaxID=189863 RepID=A0AAE3YIR9_9MICC|nr:TlyA family RNA methyltransferase [Falsarthrobacter nasiphocae]MDR6892723.1 23S rRNA (cytidine1920-2'-O)/16S rRNA (cytidine1409-2'-O)-methyltransferase [Falsarthrobacter nasiphocae]